MRPAPFAFLVRSDRFWAFITNSGIKFQVRPLGYRLWHNLLASKALSTCLSKRQKNFEPCRGPYFHLRFWPTWLEDVYSDASLGTATIAGGLGAVITQLNPGRCGKLEALAFVFVLAKFYDWLEANEFTWRTDAKAHKYIFEPSISSLLCWPASVWSNGFLVCEWSPIRKVVTQGDSEAMNTKALVCGNDYGPGLDLDHSILPTEMHSALFTCPCQTFLQTRVRHPEVLSTLPVLEINPLISLRNPLNFTAYNVCAFWRHSWGGFSYRSWQCARLSWSKLLF